MVSSKETTPAEYLASLPPERREVIAALRTLILKRLPKGYVESMNWGMLSYEIPLSRYPDTYNGRPLAYVCLVAQKNNFALYLGTSYSDPEIMEQVKEAFKASGKKMDAGKSCIRFKCLEDLPLDAIGDAIAATPVNRLVALAKAAHQKQA